MVPSPTEAGHADWAARNERDIIVLRALIERFGRAEVEHVVSGRGLSNLHRITHNGDCPVVENDEAPDAPALISEAALERRCPGCVEALEIFVAAYGAEAGNLALRAVATGGVFVGGGIAPKILPAMSDGRFLRAFLDKGSFRSLLTQIPDQHHPEPRGRPARCRDRGDVTRRSTQRSQRSLSHFGSALSAASALIVVKTRFEIRVRRAAAIAARAGDRATGSRVFPASCSGGAARRGSGSPRDRAPDPD